MCEIFLSILFKKISKQICKSMHSTCIRVKKKNLKSRVHSVNFFNLLIHTSWFSSAEQCEARGAGCRHSRILAWLPGMGRHVLASGRL